VSEPIRLRTPPVEIELELRPAGPAFELRTPGGQLVADLPADVTLGRAQAARLVRAWLAAGRPLDWRQSVATLKGD
jgi:hypothetical protein